MASSGSQSAAASGKIPSPATTRATPARSALSARSPSDTWTSPAGTAQPAALLSPGTPARPADRPPPARDVRINARPHRRLGTRVLTSGLAFDPPRAGSPGAQPAAEDV